MLQVLHFKHYGCGEPLIILHGFLGTLDNWHTLSTAFAKKFSVYNIDQRNHGKSFHSDQHSISLMVNDLHYFMQEHQVGSANIIGHSMGGKVAMQFALNFSGMVNRLIVADIAPRAYKPGHNEVFNAIFAVDTDTVQSRKEAEEKMLPHLPDFATRQFVLKNLERNQNGKFNWKMNIKALHKDYEEILKAVTSDNVFNKKALFLKGEKSNYITEADRQDILKLFPNTIFKEIANAGHWLHAEQPELFYTEVINFLTA